ncbi:hypothetical protein [Mycolicibacterium sp. J2]|uniref:hypothetical protein n=1 Tax=Mycolicibacterium sp. J2 TaxID=2993511 RepID=UPI00224B6943|nr:hypothetical protein [Mycolicibacterium sp. J2]MCX2714231.1 hypothetical protein [Mycolicibacterium sp. J2]
MQGRHSESRRSIADLIAAFPNAMSEIVSGASPGEDADVFADSIARAGGLVDAYYRNGPGRRHIAFHLAFNGDRLRKFKTVAEQAMSEYHRQFGAVDGKASSLSCDLEEPRPGVATIPDLRTYALVARFPSERTPVETLSDLRQQVVTARQYQICDLQYGDGSCDLAAWSEPVILPVSFGEIVLLSVCDYCLRLHLEKHGVSGGEIVDPDDVID